MSVGFYDSKFICYIVLVMITKLSKYKLFLCLLAVLLIVQPVTFVLAKTPEEIAAELEQKQQELSQLNSDLDDLQAALKDSQNKKNNSTSELEKIKAEIQILTTQIDYQRLLKKQINAELSLKDLQKQAQEEDQKTQFSQAYVSWKTQNSLFEEVISEGGNGNVVKTALYHELISDEINASVADIANQINQLNATKSELIQTLDKLKSDMAVYQSQLDFLQKQIDQYNAAIADVNNNADGVRAKLGDIEQQIDQLTAEQEAIAKQDDDTTGGGDDGGGNQIIEDGEYYFDGKGRDLYQGHGVGMSQFGAYGAGLNGLTANQILSLYYKNTKVEVRTGHTVQPVGYPVMSADDYAAGIGEIPSKACGTIAQIQDWATYADQQGWPANDPKRNKYIIDNPTTVWDCWPEEAIKAQVIAARSYGVTNTQPICTTAACQVYLGGQDKAWASFQTSNQYIVSTGNTHNNQIIRALYSSDNSQGYGTADNDTVWSNFSGVGTPYSYLRHVDDTATAYDWTYTNWSWRTNSYSIDEINAMFNYAKNNYFTGGANSFLVGLKNTVGKVTALSFTRDGSNRVKYVKVTGTTGTQNISGWLFKAIWNDWIYNVTPSGQYDYIYSLTWWLIQG